MRGISPLRAFNKWRAAATALLLGCGAALAHAQDPWADDVISYGPGSNFELNNDNPNTVLGAPERITGETVFDPWDFPATVTPFSTPYQRDEIVSVGAGGHLVVRFDEPIRNDPANPWGLDLILFGNGFFADTAPNFDGTVAGLFGEGPFSVSVSLDGVEFFTIATNLNDGLFPMLAYRDVGGPYTSTPGLIPTDFRKPMNPALSLTDFMGLGFADVLALYGESGGGIALDIASSGLAEAHYVRIDVPEDAASAEFAAMSAVPEPGAALLMLMLLPALRRR
ncbi:MAG: hypothetical protein HRU75_13745 [Planctomycetia bacterium]|nr:MAG: hypothetical protein HRU75_13745 [Planctomycetia bacterium]